jgi:hypothetical protein
MPWFHGGIPGLDVGDELVRRPARGSICAGSTARRMGRARTEARVFISRDPRHAATYALSYPHGDVYEVEPAATGAAFSASGCGERTSMSE